MDFDFTRKALNVAIFAGFTLGVALPITVFSAEPAFANNGNGGGKSNGNRGNGNGNASESRGNSGSASSNGNSGNNGNSAIARELAGLNAAHASPTAMANAAAESMPGKLHTYQQARLHLVQRVTEQNAAYETYMRLANMSEAQTATAYPSGDYTRALNDAARAYNAFQAQAEAAQAITDASLMSLSGGRVLSNAAMADLHRMLGL